MHRETPVLHSFPTRRSSDLTGFVWFVNRFLRAKSLNLKYPTSLFTTPSCSRRMILRSETMLKVSRTFIVSLVVRSEEHTSELQSQSNLVCRLLLEKKKEQIE